MTEAVRISPSQITTWTTCNRLWGWVYLAGFRSPDTRATALGTKVHAILEAYLKEGTPPDPNETWFWASEKKAWYPGRIALSMMGPHLARPGAGVTEGQFEWEYHGIIFNGFMDWHAHDPDVPLAMQPEPFHALAGVNQAGLIVIQDHKTSADPRKWGKTADTLPNDTQNVIYSRYTLHKYGPANVHSIWNYGGTDASPSKAKVVEAFAAPGSVYARFENDVMPVARLIRDTRRANPDPMDLPFNAGACDMYGGCPNRHRCNLTDSQRIGAFMNAATDGGSLLDSLVAQQQAGTNGATPPPTQPATMQQPPPVAGDPVNPLEALVNAAAATPATPATAATPAPTTAAAPATAPAPTAGGSPLDALVAAASGTPATAPATPATTEAIAAAVAAVPVVAQASTMPADGPVAKALATLDALDQDLGDFADDFAEAVAVRVVALLGEALKAAAK